MANPLTWYAWDVPAHLLDLDAQRLSDEEEGIYRRILDRWWWEEGELPANLDDLADVMRMDADRLRAAWPRVGRLFTEEHGRLVSPRLRQELKAAREKKRRRVAAAKAGAEARWRQASLDLGGDPDGKPDASGSDANRMRFSRSGMVRSGDGDVRGGPGGKIDPAGLYTPAFEEAWKIMRSIRPYPFTNPKRPAFQQWAMAVNKGKVLEADLYRATEAYAASVRRRRTKGVGTEYVWQAETFYRASKERWVEFLEADDAGGGRFDDVDG